MNIDLFGQELKPGDYIIRSYSLGRSTDLTISKILKSDDKGLRVANVRVSWKDKLERIKDGTIQFPGRTVKVTREFLPQEYLDLLDPAA